MSIKFKPLLSLLLINKHTYTTKCFTQTVDKINFYIDICQPNMFNMKKEKLTISVLIEGDQQFREDYLGNQKVQVVINKASENLNITSEGRELKREDGTVITDPKVTIEELGLYDGEVLRYFKKAPKPDRDKGFA